jgi:hypothetical protein
MVSPEKIKNALCHFAFCHFIAKWQGHFPFCYFAMLKKHSMHSIPRLQKLYFFYYFFHLKYRKNTMYVAVEFFVNLYMIRSEMMNYIAISFVTQGRYSIHQPFTEARHYRTLDMFDEMSIERSSNHDTVILLHRGNLHLFSGFFHDHFAVEASFKYVKMGDQLQLRDRGKNSPNLRVALWPLQAHQIANSSSVEC